MVSWDGMLSTTSRYPGCACDIPSVNYQVCVEPLIVMVLSAEQIVHMGT